MAAGEEIALMIGAGSTLVAIVMTIIVHIRSRAFDAKHGIRRDHN